MTLSAVIPASRQRESIPLTFPFSLLTFHFFSPACRVTATDGLTRPTPRLTPSASRLTLNPLHDSRILTRDARCSLSGITLSAVIPACRQRGSIRLPFHFSLLTFHFLKRDPGWQKVFHVQHATCSPFILIISDNGVQVFTDNLEAIFRQRCCMKSGRRLWANEFS
jgi:hypothetical protein